MLNAIAITAANRFGLGLRPEEAADIEHDPKGWLKAQLEAPRQLPSQISEFPTGAAQAALFLETRQRRGDGGVMELLMQHWREGFRNEAGACLEAAAASRVPFVERLVRFWSNHFTVSAQRPFIMGFAPAFEREVIRPHVLGRFSDMLLASTRHPAMLFYLDNSGSVGPDSRAGRQGRRGLNENLAREILELHTVGVEAGYQQSDVRILAEILTGWSVARPGFEVNAGNFLFRPLSHQPGDKVLLHTLIRESGEDEGKAALLFLARHPATARHIAVKLARHFISDTPPHEAVAHLEDVFRTTGGDLKAMAGALVDMEATWTHAMSKIRTPQELVVAALRVAGATTFNRNGILSALRDMNHVPWTAPSPAGWADTAKHWVAPDSMLHRVEWAQAAGRNLGQQVNPVDALAHALGDSVHPDTRLAIERAPSSADGMGLMFASAEFQRR